MSITPVIKIAVDDAAFARFHELFADYTAAVEEQPAAWQKLNDAMGGATAVLADNSGRAKEALAIAAAQAGVISEALRDAVKAQRSLGTETESSGRHMDVLRKSTEGVGKALSFVGGWIIRIGALGGLTGLLSGLGIADLAGGALNRGRDSGRLGISPGLLASFQVNAKRVLDVSDLTNAANAQGDVTKAGYLQTLGIGYGAAQNMSASDLAFEELRKATQAYMRAPRGLGQNMPAVMAYKALGGDVGNIRNLIAHGGTGLLDEAQRNTNREQGVLGFTRHAEDLWAKLDIAFDRAGMKIQSAFIDKLDVLAPKITELVGDFSNWIVGILSRDDLKHWINDAADGLENLDKFLERIDWNKLGDDIDYFAGILGLLKPQDAFWTAKTDFKGKPENESFSGQGYSDWLRGGGQAGNVGFGDSVLGKFLGGLWDKITGGGSDAQRKAAAAGIRSTGSADVGADLLDPGKTTAATALGAYFAELDAGGPGKLGAYVANTGHGDPEHIGKNEPHTLGQAIDFTDVAGNDVTALGGKAYNAVKTWLLREIVGNKALTGLGLPGQYEADKQIMAAIRARGLHEWNEKNTHIHESYGGTFPPRAMQRRQPPQKVAVSIYPMTAARAVVSTNAIAMT